jgi:sarcosine oxidase subunit beta
VDRADVVVVGGGVIGLACAGELRTLGAGDVTVVDALPATGQASSSRANGGVRAQFTTAPNVAFSRYSIEAFERIERETGLLGFRQTGYLLIAGSERTEHGLRRALDLQRSLGIQTVWLGRHDVLDRVPFIRADGLRGGTFHERDGFLDPAGVMRALDAAARAGGVTIATGTRVRAIERGGDGFRLVTDRGVVAASIVVNAAGADAREVAAMLGADLPVDPIRRNLALFLDEPGDPTPMVVDVDSGVLIRREVAGGWIVAYSDPDDPPGRDTTVDPAFFDDLAERVGARFPFLAELPIDPARCWAGLYPETPDHHAIVGPDPAVPGLVHCAGFGGHGLMHAPAAGRATAEVVVDGASTTFDLHPLRASRFVEDDLVVETAVL